MSTPAKTSASRNIGTYALTFDHDEVVQLLKAAVESEGSQVAYAKRHRLDRAYLNQILNGKKHASAAFLKALGLQNVYARLPERSR
jgi:hypothetical protein